MRQKKEIQSFDFSTIGEEEQIILDLSNKEDKRRYNDKYVLQNKNLIVNNESNEFSFLDSIKESLDFDLLKKNENISSLNYLRMANKNMETIDKMKSRILRNQDDNKQIYQILSIMNKWLLSISKYIEMYISINSNCDLNDNLKGIIANVNNAISKIESKKNEINYCREA